MSNKDRFNRILALILTVMVTVSMSAGFGGSVFAEDGDGQTVTEGQSGSDAGDGSGGEQVDPGSGSSDQGGSGDNGSGSGDNGSGGSGDSGQGSSGSGESGSGQEGTGGSGSGSGDSGQGSTDATGDGEVNEEDLDPEEQGVDFDDVIPEDDLEEEELIDDGPVVHDESYFRVLHDRTTYPSKIKVDGEVLELRELTGEGHAGNAVSQGGCTDGTYAYYLMVSSYTQKGRVLKVRMSDNAKVAISDELNICHGNGMAYDSKRKVLVINAREERRQQLTVVDASTLKITRQQNVKYTYYKGATSGLTASHQDHGIAAVAYNRKYNCYIALERSSHDLIVFDPDSFEAIGYIQTTITSKYPGVYQAMDCDDQYVYLLLSADGSAQPDNVIIALDWNSENLIPVANADENGPKFVAKPWKCGNNNDGKPDAAIKLKTPYEAENIYHVTGSDGKQHFYLTEYYNDPVYKYVNKKKAYKVKWKKVTKKVKWKKVKKKGKWKWKYKKKKVWKYKTKYKTVRVKVVSYYQRHNYVYDVGVL